MRFVDEYMPDQIPGFPASVTPRFSTSINVVDSGSETADQRWANPRRMISIPRGVGCWADLEDLTEHFLVMRGPAHTWPWRDPVDFASQRLDEPNVPPAITATDQVIGSGNGARTAFQLSKTYMRGAHQYVRPITLPIAASVLVALDGVPTTAFTVSRPGGVVTMDAAPGVGVEVTAGFLFDLLVRFESDDSLAQIVVAFGIGGFADIPLVEVPYCED